MSSSVITLSVVLSIMIVCEFILDIIFAVPFAQKMAEIHRKKKEADSNTVINHISFITIDIIMIVAYLMLGYSNPARIVLTIAGLGVGANIFMLGYQVCIVVKGYRDGKAGLTDATEVTEQALASNEEPTTDSKVEEPSSTDTEVASNEEPTTDSKVEEPSSTEATKGTDTEVETTNKEETKGTEPTTEADKANDTSSEETHNNEAEVK